MPHDLHRKVMVLGGIGLSLLNFRRELLAAMVEAGHRVIGVASEMTPSAMEGLRRLGVEPVALSFGRCAVSPVQDLNLMLRLRSLLLREAPDLLLSYTIKPVIYGSLAARIAGVPQVCSMITGLGYAFLGQTRKQRCVGQIAAWLYHLALRYNQRVFFQNPDDLHCFLDRDIVSKPGKTVLIHGSGVNLRHFQPCPPVVEPMRFLLAARLYREKGVLEFVEAARRVKRNYPQTQFQVLGGVDVNPSALDTRALQAWQRDGLITYTPWAEDVRPHMAAASVFVLPSYREGTPRSVLEAMAMGRPIITTDAPGCRETVIAGENGFLVPIKDPVALADAMERFIQNPELVAAMGQASRVLAVERFDVNKVNAVILENLGLTPPVTPELASRSTAT